MANYCDHITDILEIERGLIIDHIGKHKWCNQIADENEAIVDFVQKYAWLMREVFCGVMCPHRHGCEAADQYKKTFTDVSDDELESYIKLDFKDTEADVVKIKLLVLKNDINVHKWLNRIDNYEDGVRDFLNRFGWVIYDMYKRSKKKYERE